MHGEAGLQSSPQIFHVVAFDLHDLPVAFSDDQLFQARLWTRGRRHPASPDQSMSIVLEIQSLRPRDDDMLRPIPHFHDLLSFYKGP